MHTEIIYINVELSKKFIPKEIIYIYILTLKY